MVPRCNGLERTEGLVLGFSVLLLVTLSVLLLPLELGCDEARDGEQLRFLVELEFFLPVKMYGEGRYAQNYSLSTVLRLWLLETTYWACRYGLASAQRCHLHF